MHELGSAVYKRLFETDPEARALFKGDMSAQHRKLVAVFDELAKLQRRSQHFLPATRAGGHAVVPGASRLRSCHNAAGVGGKHYAHMRAAIISSLASMLGEKFDRTAAEAWGAAFDVLAEAIQRNGQAAPAELTLLPGLLDRKFQENGEDGGGGPGLRTDLDDFFGANNGQPWADG